MDHTADTNPLAPSESTADGTSVLGAAPYKATFDQAAIGIAHLSPDGRWLRVNDKLVATLGYPREELLTLTFQDITHPEDLGKDVEHSQRVLAGEIARYSMEKRFSRKDGSTVWANLTVGLVRDPESGEPDYFISFVEDIDARKKAEQQLTVVRQRERLLTSLLDDSSQPFALGTPEGKLVMANSALSTMLGYSEAELASSHNWLEMVAGSDHLATVQEALNALMAKDSSVRLRLDTRRKDGTPLTVEALMHLYGSDDGTLWIYAFLSDVSEQAARDEAGRLSAVLNEIDNTISLSRDFNFIMTEILRMASEAIGAKTAAVTQLENDRWVITHTHGFPAEYTGVSLSHAELPHAHLALETRGPVIINDALNDTRVRRDVIERFDVASVMVVPLQRGEKVFGAIFFNHSPRPVRFTPEQADFGVKLGAHVSLAVENARLYERQRVKAETLQEALLRLPESVTGIEFARAYHSSDSYSRVGGDFYDLFELDNGLLGVVVGDVSGKGLAAAVLTSFAKATVRAECGAGAVPPAEVLRRTNDIMVRQTSTDTFLTVFFGLLDRLDGRLVYASGGHTTGVIVRPTGELIGLPSTGPIVGAFAGMEFQATDTKIAPGDVLFLYTDGLLEARRGRELLGDSRLFEMIEAHAGDAPEALVDHVMQDVLSFAERLSDDVAVLALQLAAEA